MHVKRTAGLLAVTAGVFLYSQSASAHLILTGAMNGAQQVPSNGSTGRGWCQVHVGMNGLDNEIELECTYAGLSSGLTQAHIHGPAAIGANGVIAFTLTAPTGNTDGEFMVGPMVISPTLYAALTSNQLYLDFHTTNFPGGEIRGEIKKVTTVVDRDGDGRTEVEIFRPGNPGTFWTLGSLNGSVTAQTLGVTDDASIRDGGRDWDGDGIADSFLMHTDGAAGRIWTIQQSWSNTVRTLQWGAGTDQIAPADYDGDGVVDVAVFRNGTWYILGSFGGIVRVEVFGQAGDGTSVGDYNKDGHADVTIVRPDGSGNSRGGLC
jgi:hypothetical protein